MIAPFNRRDSGWGAVAAAILVGAFTLASAPGTPLLALLLALSLAGVAVSALGLLVRTLPPDLPLRRMPEAAARQAVAPPPPGLARLRVAQLPEPLSWVRLDLYLDGVRVAQLRPGTAVVLPMPPGPHVLTMRVWLRRLGTREMINALPGTDTDIVVRSGGGKTPTYDVRRRDVATVLLDRRMVLLESP